jgi:hypothetical protein
MKKKIFKYKFVYIYNLIFTLILFFSFSLFLISFFGIVTYGKDEKFKDILAKYLGITVLISSIISFFLLIDKNKKIILFLNLNTLFVCLFLVLALFTSLNDGGINNSKEIIILILVFSLIGLTFFLINNFKYKSVSEELNEIGTKQN